MSKVLFDTNILVYAHNVSSSFHKQARQLHEEVIFGKLGAVVAPQNLLEFYSNITNPNRIERAVSQSKALEEVKNYLASGFKLIFPRGDEMDITLSIIRDRSVLDRQIFDAYLVATMLSNGVNTVYTHNEKDFTIFKEIKVINPFKP